MQARHLRRDIRARIRRIHASLVILYLIACFIGLIACEVWRAGRSEWKHNRGS